MIAVKMCRIAAGLTQVQLAEQAGVSVATLREVERGRAVFEGWAGEKVGSTLGVTTDFLYENVKIAPVAGHETTLKDDHEGFGVRCAHCGQALGEASPS